MSEEIFAACRSCGQDHPEGVLEDGFCPACCDPCPGCGDGDIVPETGYFRCPVCDAEWDEE